MNRSEAWTHIYAAAISRGHPPQIALNIANEGLDHFIEKFRTEGSPTPLMTESDLYRALDLYVRDPASTDYQRGWLACLLSILPGDDHPNLNELQAQVENRGEEEDD
jgi:hypothetical protein